MPNNFDREDDPADLELTHNLASEDQGLVDSQGNDATTQLGSARPSDRKSAGVDSFVGTVLGDYEILEEIARGGMGVVFKARQTKLNRIVALKMILSGEFADEQAIQRFHAEAEAAAKIDHAGIVPIYEVGQLEGRHYFSMAFIDGVSLAQSINDSPLPAEDAAALLKSVAEAVEFAHQQGIVHRDLKPANILLDTNRNPRITDFGLAKIANTDSDLTGTGQILGTPSFMAPEQALGKSEEIGPAADVYALGAVLYHALTGRPPFRAASAVETLNQVVHQEPASPRRLDPSIPKDLETICLKCLRKEPRDRYPSCQQLAEELERFLQHKPIQARPISVAARGWRWCRRNRALAASLGLAGLFLVTGLVTSLTLLAWANLRDEEAQSARKIASAATAQADQKTRLASEAEEERQRALTREQGGQQQLEVATANLSQTQYENLIFRADQAWHEGQLSKSINNLEQCPDELRNWEWHYLMGRCRSETKQFFGKQNAGKPLDLTIETDGSRIAIVSGVFATINETQTGRQLFEVPGVKSQIQAIEFDRINQRIVTADERGWITIWNYESLLEVVGTKLALPEDSQRAHSGKVMDLAFLKDGAILASAGEDGEVKLWDANNKFAALATLQGHDAPVVCLSQSESGLLLASGDQNGGARVWSLDDYAEVVALEGNQDATRAVRISSDDTTLATGHHSGRVVLYRIGDGHVLHEMDAESAPIVGLQFGSAGETIRAISSRANLSSWKRVDGQLIQRFPIADGQLAVWCDSPAAGIMSCGFGNGSFKNYDIDVQPVARIVSLTDDAIMHGQFSINGSRAVTWHEDGVRCWDTVTGELVRHLSMPAGVPKFTAFSDDGRWLAMVKTPSEIEIWSTDTGQRDRVIQTQSDDIGAIAISASGDSVAASNEMEIRVWSRETGNLEVEMVAWNFSKQAIESLGFSPNGKHVLSATKRVINIMQLSTRQSVFGDEEYVDIQHERPRISPNGEYFMSKDGNRGAYLQRLKKRRFSSGFFFRHQGGLTGFSINPNGTRLVTAGSDRKLLIWDVSTSHAILTLKGCPEVPLDVVIDPSGNRLTALCANGSLVHWEIDPQQVAKSDDSGPSGPRLTEAGIPDWPLDGVPFETESLFAEADPGGNPSALYLDALFEFDETLSTFFPATERRVRAAVTKGRDARFEAFHYADENARWTAEQLEPFIKAYEPGFEKIRLAQQKPIDPYEAQVRIGALTFHVSAIRDVGRWIKWRTQYHLLRGEVDKALDGVEVFFQLARDLSRRAGLTGHYSIHASEVLVYQQTIPEVLSHPEITTAQCDRLISILQHHRQARVQSPIPEYMKIEYLRARDLLEIVRNDQMQMMVDKYGMRAKGNIDALLALLSLENWEFSEDGLQKPLAALDANSTAADEIRRKTSTGRRLLQMAARFQMSHDGIPDKMTDEDFQIEIDALSEAYGIYAETFSVPPGKALLTNVGEVAERISGCYDRTKLLRIARPSWRPDVDALIWCEGVEHLKGCLALAAIRQWEVSGRPLPDDLTAVMREIGFESIPIDPFLDEPIIVEVNSDQVQVLLVGRNGQRDPPPDETDESQRRPDDVTLTIPRRR